MQVKTFEAFSMRDAIRAVRAEFGPDAVILSTRETPLEDGKGKVVHVTAARAGATKLGGASAQESGVSDDGLLGFKNHLDRIDLRLNQLTETVVTKEQLQGMEAGIHEVKILLLEALRSKDGTTMQGLSRPLEDLYRQLKVTGVDDSRLTELMKHLKGLPGGEGSTFESDEQAAEFHQNNAIRWFLKRVRIAPRWSPVGGAPSVHAFVGTSGAGKTSTVAKLAAQYALKEKRSVLVVSYDTTRLAATEQMRIFTKVIGVPFESVEDASALAQIVERHQDKELILVDTSGRSPKSPQGIQALSVLKQLPVAVEFNLVLSTTEKEAQLDRAIRSFSTLGLQSLVFTKLDESWSYGQLFNLTTKWSLPLSFFGTGQRVPEDIERATRERVVERIFGL